MCVCAHLAFRKLLEIAQGLLDNIFNSVSGMPTGVRRILIDIHDLCLRRLPEMASSAPQVLLFLRFVNPALIAPERLMIGKKHNGVATKLATAVAKAIQVRRLLHTSTRTHSHW